MHIRREEINETASSDGGSMIGEEPVFDESDMDEPLFDDGEEPSLDESDEGEIQTDLL